MKEMNTEEIKLGKMRIGTIKQKVHSKSNNFQVLVGSEDLGVFSRGAESEIGNYVSKTLISELLGNAVDLCPVGSIGSKGKNLKKKNKLSRIRSLFSSLAAFGSRVLSKIRKFSNDLVYVLDLTDRDKITLAMSNCSLPVIGGSFVFCSYVTQTYQPLDMEIYIVVKWHFMLFSVSIALMTLTCALCKGAYNDINYNKPFYTILLMVFFVIINFILFILFLHIYSETTHVGPNFITNFYHIHSPFGKGYGVRTMPQVLQVTYIENTLLSYDMVLDYSWILDNDGYVDSRKLLDFVESVDELDLDHFHSLEQYNEHWLKRTRHVSYRFP